MVQSLPPETKSESPFVMLDRVLRQMRDCKTVQELVDLSIHYISSAFEAPLVWIAFYDAEQHQLVGQGGATLQPNCSLLTKTLSLEPGQILEQVAIEQRPIAVPDVPQELRMGIWQKEADNLGIVGCLLIPIRYKQQCLGVLMMGSQLWGGSASDEEMAVLGIVIGQLASSLQVMEEKLRQQQQKQADIPLVALGTAMRNFESMDDRVQAAIAQIQAFVEAQRVQVFWLDRERNEFGIRWSSRQSTGKLGNGPVFTARELEPAFAALVEGQLVVVGGAGLSGRIPINARTLKELGCRSIMLAPVLFEGELLGFISVESSNLRSWTEAEQTMVLGATQLIALAAPLESLEATLGVIERDRLLTSQVAQTVYGQTDWNHSLHQIAEQLCTRLDASACLMLQTATNVEGYEVRVAYSQDRKLTFPKLFRKLSGRDLEDLLCGDMAVAADSYPEDLRLTVWQEEFEQAAVRSVLAARTTPTQFSPEQDLEKVDPEGIVLVVNAHSRGWHREDRQLLSLVAHQVGVVFRQWRTEEGAAEQLHLFEKLCSAIEEFGQAQSADELYDLATTHLAQLFSAPLTAAISWPSSLPSGKKANRTATLKSLRQKEEEYQLPSPTPAIVVERDALIQWCLQSTDPLLLDTEDLHSSSRQWLQAPHLGRIMAIATDNRQRPYLPSLLLIVGDSPLREWSVVEQQVFYSFKSALDSNLTRAIAQQTLLYRCEELTELNWYKHRQLALASLSLSHQIKRLVKAIPDEKDAQWRTMEEVVRGLVEIPKDLKSVGREYWHRVPDRTTILGATLLRRVLRRVGPLVQQRKLWPRVHGEAKLSIAGHAARLEIVLVELIAAIAKRSENGSNLEIWVQGEQNCFSLSLVDKAQPLPADLLKLLDELRQQGGGFAWMAPLYNLPLLNQSPGRELFLCQAAVAQMGGDLEIYQAEDGRTVTQLRLPAVENESSDAAPVSEGEESG